MLPQMSKDKTMSYVVEAFVDDYIAIAIPTSQEQLGHVATAVMCLLDCHIDIVDAAVSCINIAHCKQVETLAVS